MVALLITEAATADVLWKRVFFKISHSSQEKSQSLFSRKLQASGLEINEKKDFDTSIFLRISRNFPEHLFCRTSSKSCFCASRTNLPQISNKEISDSIRHKLHFLRHILHERASRWVVVVTSRMDHQIFRKIYYF